MADDLTTLHSSLTDRATALGSYVYSLKADSARSDVGFRHALDVCGAYTRAFVKQLGDDWDDLASRSERRRTLETSLESFLKREQWIDQRFARGAQRDVPRALKTIARLEFRDHGLDEHEPVLTVGPPDSFETHQTSLATFLFQDIYGPYEDRVQQILQDGPDVSVFSMPYIEGTRVPWYPIVLGHEIAHSRLDRDNGAGPLQVIVARWLSVRDVEFGAVIDETLAESEVPALTRVELGEQVMSWATELTCDLNAVRLFGPAGLSAIAEFLAILESQRDKSTLDTATHPPLWVRLRVLFAYLDRLGWSGARLPDHASVWQEQLHPQPNAVLDRRAQWVATLVTDAANIDQLIDFVRGWDAVREYEAGANLDAIAHIKRELLDGVPGATHIPGDDAAWAETAIADVVNAAWAARRILDERRENGHPTESGVLLDGELNRHDKRVKLDSLASKAIDTLELSRLWASAQGIIPPNAVRPGTSLGGGPSHKPEQEAANGASAAPRGGVLSRRCVARLLGNGRTLPRNKRLVVTPLSEDSVQNAAIDLRLGPDFIVFRHSATKAFDPLADRDQDPRMLQERVHKGWGERFILHPQELVLASTLEYIVLPDDVAAQVLTRSSYGRLGLLTATAVQVQPGARGCITLELVNQGETPIELAPAARVAQLMLWSVVDPCIVDSGRYWFPVGPEFSKVGEDSDAPSLRELAKAATEPAVGRRPPVRARFEGSERAADEFDRLARSLGADDADPPRKGVVLAPRALAVTILRWLQGNAHGVSIATVDGEVVVRTATELQTGAVIASFDDGTAGRVDIPPGDVNDIAELIRKLVPLQPQRR